MERRLLHLSLLADPLGSFSGGQVGGRQVLVRESVRAVQREGFGIDVLTAEGALHDDRSALGHLARVVRLGSPEPGMAFEQAAQKWADEALSWVREQGGAYQLMHSHHWMSGAVAQQLREHLNLPWVHSPWAAAEPARVNAMQTALMHQQLEAADWVVEPYAAFAEQVLNLAPSARVRVVMPGVDVSTFFPRDPGPALKALGHDRRVLLTVVGEADAGLTDLLAAWRRRAESGQLPERARLVVAGVPSPEGEAAHWAALGVQFLGVVPHRTLARYYSAASVTLLPARHPSLGMAALESMASGTPVAASAVPGQAAVVLPGETGLLVDPSDTDQLLAAGLELHVNTARGRRMGTAAVAHVLEQYTETRMARDLAAVYEEVLQSMPAMTTVPQQG